jgi:hypothetical protein
MDEFSGWTFEQFEEEIVGRFSDGMRHQRAGFDGIVDFKMAQDCYVEMERRGMALTPDLVKLKEIMDKLTA